MAEGNDASNTVDWYFDFISPFAYLQHYRLSRKHPDIRLNPIPVLFGALLQAHGHKGPAEIPRKRTMTYRHCQWLAEESGTPLKFPPEHPYRPLPVLRLCIAAGSTPTAVDRIFGAIWAEGRNPADPEVLISLGHEIGLDDPVAAVQSDEVKSRLRKNTETAVELGVFGVPTMSIGDALFWGYDMTDLALAYLEDPGLFDSGEYSRLAELPNGLA